MIKLDSSVKIKNTTVPAEVSEKPIARLKYYLNCVNSCIDYEIPLKCRDFKNYTNVSFDDENEILKYARIFNPGFMIRNEIFRKNVNLCRNFNNEFYKIEGEKELIAITSDILLTEIKIFTDEFMAFRPEWLDNYNDPIMVYNERINAIENGTVEKLRPRKHSYNGSFESFTCLMYYLNCISNLMDLNIREDLINYQSHNNLSYDQENMILSLALVFDPQFFIEKNIMINDLLICGENTNKFYDISKVRNKNPETQFKLNDKIYNFKKVMIFEISWIEDFYNKPIKNQDKRVKAIMANKMKNSQKKDNEKSCLIQ